jgi:uncharacterized membrane protein
VQPAPYHATPASGPTSASTVVLARQAAVASLMALILLGLLWELWLAPTGGGTLALKVLPLCFPLAGLLKSRMYTYRWLSLMVWLYFTEGVVRAWSDKSPSNWLALMEVVLCIVLFVACTAHIRLRLQHAKARAEGDPSTSLADEDAKS